MGLETVELVMALEDEFQVSIPDELASKMYTVGDTHKFIVDQLVAKGQPRSPDLESEVWQRIVKTIAKEMRHNPATIRMDTRWIPEISKYG